jgi:hypothetical protein
MRSVGVATSMLAGPGLLAERHVRRGSARGSDPLIGVIVCALLRIPNPLPASFVSHRLHARPMAIAAPVQLMRREGGRWAERVD